MKIKLFQGKTVTKVILPTFSVLSPGRIAAVSVSALVLESCGSHRYKLRGTQR